MKKYLKIIILMCLGVFTLLACNEEEIPTFSGENNIYFDWAVTGVLNIGIFHTQLDSISVPFGFSLGSVTDSIINIPIKVQGLPESQDRKVNLILGNGTTATQNLHFTLPDNVVILADSTITYVPVKLIRHLDLRQQELSIKLEILSNQFFTTDIQGTDVTQINNDGDTRPVSYTKFEILFDDVLTEPLNWPAWLGVWSVKKHQLFAEVNGYTSLPTFEEDLSLFEVNRQKLNFIGFLKINKCAGTPILEEDGTEMMLASPLPPC